jgi:two-component system NtrC family sensor kinase
MIGRTADRGSDPGPLPGNNLHRELFWKTFRRLFFLYFFPLFLLAVFFHLQYWLLSRDNRQAHLAVIAEHQAYTFDLFLRERLVNLGNVLDQPRFSGPALGPALPELLRDLQATSAAFVDLGLVTPEGILSDYAGPVTYAAVVDYRDEGWFEALVQEGRGSVITDVYRGFRDQPHFTIAVRRGEGRDARVLRAALSPGRLSDYLATLEGANEVQAAIVSQSGALQVTMGALGEVLTASGLEVPRDPERGFVPASSAAGHRGFAYAWLNQTPWALVVMDPAGAPSSGPLSASKPVVLVTVAVFLLAGIVILIRTRQVVGSQLATEEQQAELSGQLVQAAKLASVGELAAGIAHEINNPLAVIAEEVGVLKDSLDPELTQEGEEPPDLEEHLGAIHEAVFRCRDITRKLLTFVRQTDVKVEHLDLHGVVDEVVDSMLANELAISNVSVEKRYDRTIQEITTDRTQLIQVFVNLVKNAIDAMPRGGRLTVTTLRRGPRAAVSIRDTGVGMSPAHLEKVFIPFFTTKEPGKGTGLGLSVSYSIIRNFGGDFYVESNPGRGSTFTVELPLALTSGPAGPRE